MQQEQVRRNGFQRPAGIGRGCGRHHLVAVLDQELAQAVLGGRHIPKPQQLGAVVQTGVWPGGNRG